MNVYLMWIGDDVEAVFYEEARAHAHAREWDIDEYDVEEREVIA